MDNSELRGRDCAHLIHPMHHRSLIGEGRVWSKGRGATLMDSDGREYLDALGGLWNALVGYGRRELVEAAARQMSELPFASLYSGSTHVRAIELAERLAALCYPGVNRFFFTTSGAEAVEAALKTARYFWKAAGQQQKTKFITLSHGYHGLTMGAMSAMGLPQYATMFEPRMPGFVEIASPYPYRFEVTAADRAAGKSPGEAAADLWESAIVREGSDTIAAFLAEPVQAAGGTIVPPDDYWPRVREICDRHGVLLIADEVVTAFGRCGYWFALSRYGIEPDIVTFAKGITSGYFPLGGMGVSDAIGEAIDAGSDERIWAHGSTNSGHPVGCAVALANLDVLEREVLLPRAGELGRRLLAGLRQLASHKNVGDVRGQGLLAGVELVEDKATRRPFEPAAQVGRRIHEVTQRRGMVTRMRGDIYQFAPPFVASDAEIDRMVNVLGEAIYEVLGT
jgi:adenosylmethionine-8-amino-7-oxononanoate aminotransferase